MQILGLILCLPLLAQQQAAPNRLTINWLVREDVFAGLLQNDKVRLEKGMATLNAVEKFYSETEVTAWRAVAETTRAVWALEAGDKESFARSYALGMTYFDQSRRLAKGPLAVIPEIFEGGTLVVLADRLPENLRRGAWETTYQDYRRLNAMEQGKLESLPMHMKGEILAGLAMATQRTGRDGELAAALTRVQEMLPKTPYAAVAKKWAEDPASRTKVRLACLSCHEPNRLVPAIERSHQVAK